MGVRKLLGGWNWGEHVKVPEAKWVGAQYVCAQNETYPMALSYSLMFSFVHGWEVWMNVAINKLSSFKKDNRRDMVFWLKFSVSSANLRVKDHDAIYFFLRVIKWWSIKAQFWALESHVTPDRRLGSPHVLPTWTHFISLYKDQTSFHHWQKLPKGDLNCECFTCLLRGIDHTDVVSKLEGTQHGSEDSENQGPSDLWGKTQG